MKEKKSIDSSIRFVETSNFLLAISFIEGGAVMAVELIGAKMIAPYFGSSLYVWSSILAVTLFGLTSGYYLGGLSSEKKNESSLLYYIVLLASILTGLMPVIGRLVMESTLNFDFRTGAIISSMVFIFPPLLLFGMVSPIIIRKLSKKVEESGKKAGMVYSLSTVGGILTTFLVGFYFIPEVGLRMSSVYMSLILAIIPIYYFLRRGKTILVLVSFLFASLLIISSIAIRNKPKLKTAHFKEIYKSDGLLGQLLVVDYPLPGIRGLHINNISQTNYHLATGRSQWTYVHRLALYSSFKPKGSEVFLAGIGGGNVVNELKILGFNVDACDIEKRMEMVAKKYFGMNPDINFIEDDARHAIKVSKKKYDIVILDVSAGENQPNNLYTIEGFNDIKKIMNKDAILFIHYPSMLEKEQGIALKSIVKTVRTAGFKADLINTTKNHNVLSEYIVFASLYNINLEEQSFERRDHFADPFRFPLKDSVLMTNVDLSGGLVLTDDKPIMDKLHQFTAYGYRSDGINQSIKPMIDEGLKMF